MTRFTGILFIVLSFGLFTCPLTVRAQGFGGAGNLSESGRGGSGSHWTPAYETALLQPEYALNYITIDGTADMRIEPEGIRLVLAITSEAETADGCQEKNAAQVEAVREAWAGLNIPEENIVDDFINVLPVYEWRLIDRDGQQVRVQQREGYRMQSNLHLSIKTEQEAMAAINLAFKQGVTDIVTFDYWSSKLDEQKVKARAAAIAAAQEKAKALLVVFPDPPKVINIQESTAVFYPHALYRTYENVLEEEVQFNSTWRDKPAIRAYRPKMTFYQGLQTRSDKRPSSPAMRPEIAVVSTVRIYYQSPADKTVVGKGN
ncbi:MAG TPA: SIMPL domain-containing protein [Planctomycetaceae bacterium]|nr:SIMPL domain-containing protein [Planctomycetaceae bacterium]